MKIIMYHYVREPDPRFPEFRFLHVEDFRRQLDHFSATGRLISRETLECALATGDPLSEDDYLLTFDDGLTDHVRYVLPELVARDAVGIFFPCSGPLETGRPLDVHLIHCLLGARGGKEMLKAVSELVAPEILKKGRALYYGSTYVLQPDDEAAEFKRILNYYLGPETRSRILDELVIRYLPDNNLANLLYMDVESVRELHASGMIVGSHTRSHTLLAKLAPQDQHEEIVSANRFWGSILCEPLEWFCYPYGGAQSYTRETVNILREAGVRYAVSVASRSLSMLDLVMPLELPRFDCMEYPHGQAFETK